MSRSIDERIVEMRFDNKQFESGVKTTMDSLAGLKKALNLEDAAKGFSNLDSASKKVDLSGIQNAVETVSMKFSAMEVVAITALMNITNRAVDAGIQLVKSLSTDQIAAGWDKYAQKTSAVQTIMAATNQTWEEEAQRLGFVGSQMDYVNAQMDKLNWFTDETSYNFVDMVSNIGKFTSNQIPLEQSVTAMQGIANWAAISGANTQEASRAMYNLSQAIAVGSVKLIDWKSIENANMATAEFKQTAIETALELGTLREVSEGVYETLDKGTEVSVANFNSALSEGWFSSEVLLTTLDRYGSFTDKLHEISEEADLTATELLEMTDSFLDGSIDMEEAAKDAGLSVDQLTEYLETLGDESYDFGRKAFKAAQEAKTFEEAIEATKDAVSTGWLKTFELIFGDYETAKKLWTGLSNELYDIFAEPLNAQNEVLQKWAEAGGRSALFEGIGAAWANIKSILGAVADAYHEIFPKKDTDEKAKNLLNLTNRFRDFMTSLKESERFQRVLENLKRTFGGLFAVFSILKQAVGAVLSLFSPLGRIFGTAGDGVLGLTARLGDFLVGIDKFIKESGIFTKAVDTIHRAFSNIADFLAPIIERIKNGLTNIIETIKEFARTHFKMPDTKPFENFADRIETRFEPLKKIFEVVKVAAAGVVGVFKALAPVLTAAVGAIGRGLKQIQDALANAFNTGNFDNLFDILNGGILAGIGLAIKKFIDNINGSLGSSKNFLETLRNIGDAIVDTFGAVQQNLKAKTLKEIAVAIGILTASLVVLSLIDSDKLAGSLGAITVLFTDLMLAMTAFSAINKKFGGGSSEGGLKGFIESFLGRSDPSKQMIKVAAAVLVLSGALMVLSKIDPDRLMGALGAITVLMTEMTLVSLALSRFSGKAKTGMLGLIGFATGITILASALKKLSDLDFDDLMRGLLGITVLMTELSAVMWVASKTGGFNARTGLAIIEIAAAMLIFGKAIKQIGSLDMATIGKGLLGIAGSMASLVLAMKYMKTDGIMKTATAMVIFGAALKVFGSALKQIGSLDLATIGKGLLGIGGTMVIVVKAFNSFKYRDSFKVATSMVVMGAALKILGSALNSMGSMSLASIGKGLLAIGGALAIIVIAFNSFNYADTLKTSAAMLVMSTALIALGGALKIMGSMSLGEIGKSLLVLAGAFVVLGVAAYALKGFELTLLAMAGSITLLGVAMAACGVGLLAFSAGLAALAVSGVAGAAALVSILEILVVGLLNVIANSAEAFARAIKAVVLSALSVFTELIPDIVEALLKMIDETLVALAAHSGNIVDSIMSLLINVIDAIAARIPELIVSVVNLVMQIFAGVIEALKGINPEQLLKGIAAVGLLTALMYALAGVVSIVPAAMVGVLGVAGVVAEMTLLLAAIGAMAQIPGLKWLVGEGGDLLQGVGTAIGKFVGGIVGGALEGLTSGLPEVAMNLSRFMGGLQPFLDGAEKIQPETLEGVKSLANIVLTLTAANVLDGLTSWFTGGNSLTKFGEELAAFGPSMSTFAASVKDVDPAVVTATANAAQCLATLANDIPNSGGVVGWFMGENDIDTFGEQLVAFGKGMAVYGAVVKDVDPAVITATANAATALAELANKLPNSGGVVGWFMGENDIDTFGTQLEAFGLSMAKYSSAVEGRINEDAITASVNAAQVLVALAKDLPNTGGLVGFVVGNRDLASFGESLIPFGAGLVVYCQTVKGKIDQEAVDASVSAAQLLVALNNDLPKTGGLISFVTGEQDLGDFAEKLIPFGVGLVAYSDIVAGKIDKDAIEASATAAEMLVALNKDLPQTGGLFDFFSGRQDLASFGESLIPFGESLATYSQAVAGQIDKDAIEASATAASMLVELNKSLPETGGLFDFLKGRQDLGDFGKQLIPFGQAMSEYSDAITSEGGIDTKAIEDSANAARALVELATYLPNTGGIVQWFTGQGDLSSFGESLVSFGKGLSDYSAAITANGIDVAAIEDSTNAGRALMELATYLPNTGGIVQWFTGQGDLGAFGESLVTFGDALSAYNDAISGIEVGVIEDSAIAAGALVQLANDLPNMGGVVSWFKGQNDLGTFGESLRAFGLALVGYSVIVAGIEPGVIENSVTAATALVELAAQVPNMGGAVEWFTGSNDFETFGSKLVPFGEALSEYSQTISGLDPAVVTASADAAAALVALANALPNTGGLISFFTGSNDLGSFGESLKKFGSMFKEYYNEVQGINGSNISGVVDGVRDLIALANEAQGVDVTGLTNFAQGLKKMGTDAIDQFVQAFSDGQTKALTAVNQFIQQVTTKFRSGFQAAQYRTTGQTIIRAFTDGMSSMKASAIAAVTNICQTVISRFRTEMSVDVFKSIGAQAGQGLADGIKSKINEIANAAIQAAKQAVNSAKQALNEHSPSKVMFEVGEFFDLGFANGIRSMASVVGTAGEEVADVAVDSLRSAIESMNDLIGDDFDYEPTIRPVLDLTDVKAGAAQMQNFLTRGIDLTTSYNRASGAMIQNDQNGVSGDGTGGVTQTVNNYFTQNNTSPKALSRLDIYRQTKNLFTSMKGAVATG